jgi:uncharacterized protein with FMN-binding domain
VRRAAATTLSTLAGLVLLLSLKPHHNVLATPQTTGSTPSPSATPSTSAPRTTGSAGSPSASPSVRSATFTGDTISTRFGPVQVAVTLTNQRLTAVKVLQVPSDNPRDQEIASFAVPTLTSEALQAQSAQIDTVSGATYTSQGYIQSLQSALDKAGA